MILTHYVIIFYLSKVIAEVSRRSLSVSVDGSSPDSVSVRGNQLDVDNRLYLGGLPHTHTTKRINVGHFKSTSSITSTQDVNIYRTHSCDVMNQVLNVHL